jgi:hypothetical protein
MHQAPGKISRIIENLALYGETIKKESNNISSLVNTMSTVNSTSGWTKEYEALPVLRKLKDILRIQGFGKVQFIIFYGSVACGEATPDPDLDICIYILMAQTTKHPGSGSKSFLKSGMTGLISKSSSNCLCM